MNKKINTGIKPVKFAEGLTTDYVGSYVYKNNVLQYILTDYGKIIPIGTSFTREYNITDHLGNIRVTFNETGEILQEDSYYPFGLTMQGLSYQTGNKSYNANLYLYNGKELQQELDLDWYDYGARMYDAQLGRFHTQDRFAEKYYSLTPYHYGANNPVLLIDVNGDSIKNGYQAELDAAKRQVATLEDIASSDNNSEEIKKIATKRLKHENKNLTKIQKLYNQTEQVISDLQNIDSELFNEINTITNSEGTETDVYVKAFIMSDNDPIYGTTNLKQNPKNENEYNSKYGLNTVSVRVQVGNVETLAHEFGHVKYQVPNLATYAKYYDTHYGNKSGYPGKEIGHLPGDPSGQMVNVVMKRFYQAYKEYKKNK